MNRIAACMSTGLLFLLSCAATESKDARRLPFHIAIIPLVSHHTASDASGEEMRLVLDTRRVEHLLIGALKRRCATRVTLLTDEANEEGTILSPSERNSNWVKAASAVHADLLLECELEYDPRIEDTRNEKFWLNMPLFLLGGPACYFVNDRSYDAHATLQGRVLDMNPIAAGRADLEDGLSALVGVNASFERTSLDFIDRAGANPLKYATSIFIPPGLLASRSEDALEAVTTRVESGLVDGFTSTMLQQSKLILEAASVANFSLDPAVRATRHGQKVCVSGDILLRRGEVERLDSWSLLTGNRMARGKFAEGDSNSSLAAATKSVLRFRLDAEVGIDDDVHTVQLEIVEAGPNPTRRSFTLLIEDQLATKNDHASPVD